MHSSWPADDAGAGTAHLYASPLPPRAKCSTTCIPTFPAACKIPSIPIACSCSSKLSPVLKAAWEKGDDVSGPGLAVVLSGVDRGSVWSEEAVPGPGLTVCKCSGEGSPCKTRNEQLFACAATQDI